MSLDFFEYSTEIKKYVSTTTGKYYTKEELIGYIKDGNDIEVQNEHGFDTTDDLLCRLALNNSVIYIEKHRIQELLVMHLDREIFYDIIRAGGLDNYLNRAIRGVVCQSN